MGTSGLGALLVEAGLLTEHDRSTIRRTSGGEGAAFARGLLALGLLDEDELASFLAEHTSFRVAAKDLKRACETSAAALIAPPLLQRLGVVPLRKENQTLIVATPDPLDADTLRQLEFFTGCSIVPEIATFSQIHQCLAGLIPNYQPPTNRLEEFLVNHAVAASRRQRLTDPKARVTTPPSRAERGGGAASRPGAFAASSTSSGSRPNSRVAPPRPQAASASSSHLVAPQSHRAGADVAREYSSLTTPQASRVGREDHKSDDTPDVLEHIDLASGSSDAALDDFANDSELIDGDDLIPTAAEGDDPFSALEDGPAESGPTEDDELEAELEPDSLDMDEPEPTLAELTSEPSFRGDDSFENLEPTETANSASPDSARLSTKSQGNEAFSAWLGAESDASELAPMSVDPTEMEGETSERDQADVEHPEDEKATLDAAVQALGHGALGKDKPRLRDTTALASIMVTADETEDFLNAPLDGGEDLPQADEPDTIELDDQLLAVDPTSDTDANVDLDENDSDLVTDTDDLIPTTPALQTKTPSAHEDESFADPRPSEDQDAQMLPEEQSDPLAAAVGQSGGKPESYAVTVNRALLAMSLASDAREAATAAGPALAACGLVAGILLRLSSNRTLELLCDWNSKDGMNSNPDFLARCKPLSLLDAFAQNSEDWTSAAAIRQIAGLEHLQTWTKQAPQSQLFTCVLSSSSTQKLATLVACSPQVLADQGKRDAIATVLHAVAQAC